MPKTLTMIDPRPNGSGGQYERGQTYTLADDLADYFLSIGVARYPTLQQTQVLADRDPATGEVSTIGTGRDPLGAPVVAVTSPGGVVRFDRNDESDRLGTSMVAAVRRANPNNGQMRVRVVGGPATHPHMIEAAFGIAGGEYILHRIGRESDGFIRHYDSAIAVREISEKTHLTNAVDTETSIQNLPSDQLSSGFISTSTRSPYTTTVGKTVTFSFYGSGLDLRLNCDNRGGGWDVAIDGQSFGVISVYEAVVGWKTRTVARGLTEANHVCVMTFVGADGVNTPEAGGPRGWLSQATPPIDGAQLRSYGMIRPTLQREVYTLKHQLASPASNIEAAIKMKKSGAVYTAEFWPNHGAAGVTAMVDQSVYLDGVEINMLTADIEWASARRIDFVQRFTVQMPAEATEKLADGFMRASLTAAGYEYELRLDIAQPTDVSGGYGVMCAAHNCDRVQYNTGLVADTSAHGGAMEVMPALADSAVLYDPTHPYVWAYDIIDFVRSCRMGRPASKRQWTQVQARSDGVRMTKCYNWVFNDSGTLPAGERIVISGRFAGGRGPI